MPLESEETQKTGRLWRRYVYFGVPVAGAAAAFVAGIMFWGGFNTAMEATNTMTFCISCHEMEDNVYAEYQGTIHDVNRSGVGAVCSDCHVPKDWTHKIIRKIKASKEVWGKLTGSIATPEKFDAKRLELAMHEWERMKGSDSRECRNCHDFESMLPEKQRPRARQQHLNAIETGQTCIDCHKGIAHKDLRDRADEEYLAELESPNPDYARKVPQLYLDSLARIEAKEAAEADAAAAAAKAQQEAVAAQIAAAVEKARAEEQAKASGQAAPAAASGDTVGGDLDWGSAAPVPVTLFYPGQASFEWVQNGKTHGGARPFTKGGDKCSTCHAKELANMGAKIVKGEKAEPTPIPGKRGSIDVTLQATHDAENLYLKLQWEAAPHTPVPFVDGGKMDPENPVKVAMMIAGTGIEYVDQAGCWATCHNDNRYMPDAPDAAALGAAGDVAARIGATDYVTKYIAESRTDIELKGRGGKPLGGWDKLKEEGEITALLEGGSFMDVLRASPSAGGDNGHILEQRVSNSGGAIESSVTLEGNTWTAVIKRPLDTGATGDIKIEPGKVYTVGFAIHDDFTSARFHHVSMDWRLGLDDPGVEINATAQ
ncbi:NapC/NirT family cytochrome c [Thioclava sp. A2]|uniref:NapC/NirT family cytochrome c n=1 Tax=Thioclava sp. FCG-A2 TaxID=3080562 RepID=UPI002954B27D|nr:NapC/NirT family cytochrome c [Thioclava sp. A2]MDV7270898.1 NapC/NirT family cytochrome c [Thioclava sp. A2]